MPQSDKLEQLVFKIKSKHDFHNAALDIFHFQYAENLVYKQFVDTLSIDIQTINHFSQIPFLPIEFFKTKKVVSGVFQPEIEFSSSGTGGGTTSVHLVRKKSLYEQSFFNAFEMFFGLAKDWNILALLPSYLERGGSSLVYMVDKLIKKSGRTESSFYLHDHEKLYHNLMKLRDEKKKTLLLGVSYALLDMAENFPFEFPDLLIMETGGMKGQRKELVRSELHEILKTAFHTESVLSEYGMTELLSQAYSLADGIFQCPPWMKVLIRDTDDPLSFVPTGKTGGINIIDLANLYSCSFIATQDLGLSMDDGSFEVLGRFDNSDVRGCNLMVV